MVITNRSGSRARRPEIAAILDDVRREIRFLDDMAIVWHGGSAGTREARRGSSGSRSALERGRSALAPSARQVFAVSLT